MLLELEFAENIFFSSSQNPFSTSDKKTVVAGQCWVKLWKIAIRKHGHAFLPTRVMFGAFFVVFRVVLRVAFGGRKKREKHAFPDKSDQHPSFLVNIVRHDKKISGDMKIKQGFSLLVHVTMVVVALMMRIMQVFLFWST